MGNYLTLLGTIAPVFLLLGIGFSIRRLKWLAPEADQSLLNVVIKILYPCLILNAVLDNPAMEQAGNLLVAPVLGVATVLIGFALAALALPLMRFNLSSQARTFVFAIGIFNYGYLPIPLVEQLYDRETLGVLLLFNVGVEAAFWTVGIVVLTGISLRKGWKQILNPPAISLALALFLNFTGLAAVLPGMLLTTIALLGACAIPLGLLLIGATLGDFSTMIKDSGRIQWRVPFAASALRLGLIPLAFLALAYCLPTTPELKRVLVIQAAMPAAIFPIVIARHYGGHPATALSVVLATTCLSLLLIPLWLNLGSLWIDL